MTRACRAEQSPAGYGPMGHQPWLHDDDDDDCYCYCYYSIKGHLSLQDQVVTCRMRTLWAISPGLWRVGCRFVSIRSPFCTCLYTVLPGAPVVRARSPPAPLLPVFPAWLLCISSCLAIAVRFCSTHGWLSQGQLAQHNWQDAASSHVIACLS